jgi:integrase
LVQLDAALDRTNRQADGASSGTINRELALLRRMFNLAMEDGMRRTAQHFPMLKEAPPRKGFFEYGEFQRLRRELPEYLRPVTTVAYYTGMRRGEILKIRWDSVDLQAGDIRSMLARRKTMSRVLSRSSANYGRC